MSKTAVAVGAGLFGLCILFGVGRMGADYMRLRAARQRPRAPWEI